MDAQHWAIWLLGCMQRYWAIILWSLSHSIEIFWRRVMSNSLTFLRPSQATTALLVRFKAKQNYVGICAKRLRLELWQVTLLRRRYSVHPAHAHSPNHTLRAQFKYIPVCLYTCMQHAFSQARPCVKLSCSAACIKLALALLQTPLTLLFVSHWLNAVHKASIWLSIAQYCASGIIIIL